MGVVALLGMLVVVSGCAEYRIATEITEQKPSIIAGTVFPHQEGIKVQLTQNYSLVGETATDGRGNYEFRDVPEGKYGLLFTWDEKVYVYNDTINRVIVEWNPVNMENRVVVVETVIPSFLILYNFNLSKESPDYVENNIGITFVNGTDIKQIEALLKKYQLQPITLPESITSKSLSRKYYGGIITMNESVLEIVVKLKQEKIIEWVYPDKLYTTIN